MTHNLIQVQRIFKAVRQGMVPRCQTSLLPSREVKARHVLSKDLRVLVWHLGRNPLLPQICLWMQRGLTTLWTLQTMQPLLHLQNL